MFISLLFCFVSLLSFFLAPNGYSFGFSFFCLIFYCIMNFFYFLRSKDKGIGFEYFYMIAFGMTNFIYPVFYFLDNRYVSLFSFSFNTLVMSKATALAIVAYSFYLLGLELYRKKIPNKESLSEIKIDNIYPVLFLMLSFFSFLFFVIFGGLDHFKSVYSGDAEWSTVGVYSYFYLIFNYSSLLLAMFIYKNKNKFIMLVSNFYLLAVVVLLLFSGSRMTSIGIVLILLVSYSKNIKRISLTLATFVVFISSILLYGVMLYRSMFSSGDGGINDIYLNMSNGFSIFDGFMDLIINNRNLYVLVDFVDDNGNLYFANVFYNIISFLPFSQSINNLVGIPEYFNGNLTTFLEFGVNKGFGLGTNNVGEAYLAFGIIGVILFFLFFGYLLNLIKDKANYSIVFYILYFVLISISVIYPRGNVLINTRVLIWPILIFFIVFLVRRFLIKITR